MVRNAALSERKSTLVPRIRFSRPPDGLRKILIIPQMTMVEMKWGAYSTVCTTRLNFAKRNWLMHRDRMMGMGKLHSRLYRLSKDGVLDHAHTVGCGEEPLKPVQTDPLGAGDAPACLEIAEGDLDAVHGPVLINDGQHHRDQQHHIELPVFPQPLAEAFAVDRDSVQLTCG